MFGEEEYEAELRSLVDQLGITDQVEFLGFVDNVSDVLVGIDCLVHASVIPEPFGQVVVEGMAAGLPVIASAEGGPAEVITDGVDGLLCPPGDSHALAELLQRLASDPEDRHRLGEAGRRRARDFSPAVIGEQMMNDYRSVLSRR
jgi:glycosyltransferase involved in cell wall biosynthesis